MQTTLEPGSLLRHVLHLRMQDDSRKKATSTWRLPRLRSAMRVENRTWDGGSLRHANPSRSFPHFRLSACSEIATVHPGEALEKFQLELLLNETKDTSKWRVALLARLCGAARVPQLGDCRFDVSELNCVQLGQCGTPHCRDRLPQLNVGSFLDST